MDLFIDSIKIVIYYTNHHRQFSTSYKFVSAYSWLFITSHASPNALYASANSLNMFLPFIKDRFPFLTSKKNHLLAHPDQAFHAFFTGGCVEKISPMVMRKKMKQRHELSIDGGVGHSWTAWEHRNHRRGTRAPREFWHPRPRRLSSQRPDGPLRSHHNHQFWPLPTTEKGVANNRWSLLRIEKAQHVIVQIDNRPSRFMFFITYPRTPYFMGHYGKLTWHKNSFSLILFQ